MKVIKEIYGWVIPIAVGLFIALIIRENFFTLARVDGTSMDPNLYNNEQVMVLRQDPIKHLSVVIFDAHGEAPGAINPNTNYVKRVIGEPGDTVTFDKKNISVNGKVIDRKFISYEERTNGTQVQGRPGPWSISSLAPTWPKDKTSVKVPKDEYFVLGDHRSVSYDSRYWGFVPKNKVIGVAKTFPWSSNATTRHNINDLGY